MAGRAWARLSCNITREQDQVLRAHAREKGGSVRTATEAAVTMLMTIDRAWNQVTVTEADGTTREVIFIG